MRERILHILMALGLLLQVPAFALAQGREADTLHLKIFFESGSSVVNPDYKRNGSRISSFEQSCRQCLGSPEYDNPIIKIRAGASPGGSTDLNEELSRARSQSVKAFFSHSLSLHPKWLELFPIGEDWTGLAESLRGLDKPWSAAALEIVESTPTWTEDENGRLTDSRKEELRNLENGEVWRYLVRNVFPEVCNVAHVQVVFPRSPYRKADDSRAESTRSCEQGARDTLAIRFRFDSTRINPNFAGNRFRIDSFLADFRLRYAGMNPAALQWDIFAGASPEGKVDHNSWLGRERGKSIAGLIVDSLGVSPQSIRIHNLESRWAELYESVAQSEEPWRDEALAIIAKAPSLTKRKIDAREDELRALADGEAWPVLLKQYLAPLRSGGSAVVTYKPELDTLVYREPVPAPAPQPRMEEPAAEKVLPCDTLSNYYIMSNGRFYYPPKQQADTLEIRFRLDSIKIDLDFASNRSNVRRFLDVYNRQFSHVDPAAVQLDIYAGASPEGTADHNYWLGRERGASIRRLVRDSLGLRLGTVVVHNLAARWDEFYESIEDSNEPWKEEVLEILRMEPSRDPHLRDHRETKLRALREGTVWPVLLEKYLSPLRSGGSAILSYKPELDSTCLVPLRTPLVQAQTPAPAPVPVPVPVFVPSQKDTVVIKDTLVIVHNYPVPGMPVAPVKKEAEPFPAWALKTNLLFVAALAPNLQVEYPLGWNNRWSLEAEIICPWWVFNHNAYAEQLLNFGLECRLWLGNRKYHPWLDGWHLGLGGGFGYYDFEINSHGHQGEYVNGFVNLGYQHRWGRRKQWGVDAGVALGVIYTPRTRRYLGSTLYPVNHTEEYDDHLMYQEKEDFLFPGATHINVTLMYLFDIKRKTK